MTAALQVSCPRCYVDAEAPCVTLRGHGGRPRGSSMESYHQARRFLADRGLAVRVDPTPRRRNEGPHRLLGRRFGALKIIARWGSQSGNIAWAYYCLACGHVSKRLGAHLVSGRTTCPNCRAMKAPPGPAIRPDPEKVKVVLADAPPARQLGYCRPALSTNRRLTKCTTAELEALGARIAAELARRVAPPNGTSSRRTSSSINATPDGDTR